MDPGNAKLISYAVPAAVIVLVLALRLRRMNQVRKLRLEILWIFPAFLAFATALAMVQAPPAMSDLPWLAMAVLLGAAIGWYRGKMMHIMVDPATHALNQKASPAALIFIVGLLVIRYGLRAALESQAANWHVSINLITDAFLVFAVAMFAATRLEMFIRARRMLAEARGA